MSFSRSLLSSGSRRGFTLIELLIVVAILAIITGGSLTVIIAPMQEQAFASIDHSRQTGESTCLARLVEDAHAASAITAAEPGKLVLETTGSAARTITYYIDSQKHLRRHSAEAGTALDVNSAAGAALLDDVQSFTVEPIEASKLYRVRLASGTTRYNRILADAHELTVGVGATAWSGEAVR